MKIRKASSFILAFEDDASGKFADHSLNLILLCRDFIANTEKVQYGVGWEGMSGTKHRVLTGLAPSLLPSSSVIPGQVVMLQVRNWRVEQLLLFFFPH